ncbi:hypothetical protein VTJ49DRAFT_2941 [Mycothermus thermophilus]|uniref:Major facilitator superfamily (MFS) profile domain-containing protein n=1 Tax=Humicola insolens TaxID=85995 RepID=A0ABR3V8Q3_HUMIN
MGTPNTPPTTASNSIDQASPTKSAATLSIRHVSGESTPPPTGPSRLHTNDQTSQNAAITTPHDTQWLTGTPLAIISSLIATAVFLMMLDASIISTAIPRITDTFHSLPDIGWYASIYQLSSAVLQPLSGRIYQRFPNKPSFLTFLFLFELGSLICGAASSSAMLIAGRAVAGMGSAGLVTGGLTIIAASAPLHKRAALVGVIMGVGQMGLAIGPLLGGVLTSYVSWRWCFYVNLPVGGLLVLGLGLASVPEQCPKPSARRVWRSLQSELDLPGLALLAPAAVQLLLALEWGGSRYSWGSVTVVGLFCGSAVAAWFWFLWNWFRGDAALMPVSLMRVRAVWTGAITHCLIMTGVFCASFFLPIYFQAVKGVTPMMSGVCVLASVLSQLVALPLAGRMVELTGYVIPFALFSAIAGAVSNGLYSTLSPATSTAQWIGYQVLNGFGRGVGMPMAVLAVQAALPPHDLAMGNAIIMFVQTLGTAITLAASDAIFEGSLEAELPLRAPRVNAAAVLAAGATHFREIVAESDLPGVVAAYAASVDRVFYLAAGASVVAAFSCLGLEWVDMREKERLSAGDDVPLEEYEG